MFNRIDLSPRNDSNHRFFELNRHAERSEGMGTGERMNSNHRFFELNRHAERSEGMGTGER